MNATLWVTIGVAISGAASTWGAFWLLRLLRSVDRHGEAIGNIRTELALYVKREAHDVANAELAAQMERMRLEAQAREGRIVGAIESATKSSTEEIRFLRGEFGQMHQRIDRIRDGTPPDQSRRRS